MGAADDDHTPENDRSVTSKPAIGEGASQGFDFFSSVLAGMLLGLGADWMFGTAPVMVIIGVIAGFVSGFAKLWAASSAIEDEARRRGRL